ncbi:GNAT family N-acetyltransferase [Variovorax sp. J22R133]|uniref:GNAT family N-acetyltransferase n=1 Tax=Variovorax brevis TaxID=3053503 RepID=UPI0025785D52|nr:GNAT family N-acetyltransferase [Variovorax sp. J22R133]MDM0117478.1 GNAT family N-acetyltransferase [Variovorax sp. J22R133]
MNALMNPVTAAAGIVSHPLFDTQALESWLADPENREGQVRVRLIEPDDLEREREFVNGLSAQTSYLRLMSARKPTDEELQRWTRIDRSREGALVATVVSEGRERQVGVARYVLDGPEGQADFAVVVADEWQGEGLGKRLILALIDLARESGVKHLLGSAMSDNRRMLALARRLGFRLSKEPGAATITNVSLSLQ